MTEPDPSLQDPQALDEIELYGELVIAATESAGPLGPGEIDAVLGVAAERATDRPRHATKARRAG